MKRALLCLMAFAACKKEAPPAALGEAIAVEQPGGSSSQLFTQGSEVPVSATESFTTARDGERRILIHLLRGSGKSLRGDAWYGVDGVGQAKAGEPRVLVTFEVDAQGQVAISAREDERRLTVRKLDKAGALSPSPLTEPDDEEDADDDAE